MISPSVPSPKEKKICPNLDPRNRYLTLLGQKDCKLFSFDNCVRNRGMKNVLCTKRAEENN